MKTEAIQKNRGEMTQRTLWFFGTALSQKTPRTRIASFLLLSSLLFILSSTQVHALVTPGVASKAGNLSRGLIGYWTFDGKNMTSATSTDTSGSGNDGAFHGSPTVSLGAVGQAVTLNGSNQYISAIGNNNTTFSVSAWFKRSQSANYGPILEYSDSSNKRYSVFIDGVSPGFIGMLYTNAGTNQYKTQTSGTRKDDGLWHHVVVASANDANPVMYIDGVQVTLGNLNTPSSATSPSVLEIGTFTYTPGSTYLFNGQLDDIRLYNRVLSASEALALYKMANNTTSAVNNKNSGTSNGGLVGWWTFDGKNLTNATATDIGGSGYDGTLTNMTATSSSVLGKVGQALTFNGSNQYVNVGNNPLVGATKFTYSSWIKVSTSDFTGAFKTLVDDATGDANVNNGIVIGVDDRGGASPTAGITAMFHTATGCSLVYSSNIFSNTSQWYHITLAYNGVSTPTLYVNGVSKSYTTGVCSSGSGAYVPRSANMWLGAVNNGSYYFKGTMDDVRLYNRALSTSEITALYKTGQTSSSYGTSVSATNPIARGLVSNITFDGKYTNTSTSTDVSGTGNDGGLSAAPVFALGKVGQALSFNASNYVNLGNASNLQLSNGTLSAWVKTSGCTGASGYCGIITKSNAYSLYTLNNVFGSYDWGGGAFRTSSVNIADGKWHHIAETFQSGVSNGSVLYLDGAPVLTTTMTINSQLYAAEIGRGGTNGGQSQLWNGLVDDARIYNRPLTAKEILTLYKMGAK